MIHDTSHGDIRKSINHPGPHEQQPHHKPAKSQNFGVKHHQIVTGKNKAEIIPKVTKHIADFVPDPEWTHLTAPVHTHISTFIHCLFHIPKLHFRPVSHSLSLCHSKTITCRKSLLSQISRIAFPGTTYLYAANVTAHIISRFPERV